MKLISSIWNSVLFRVILVVSNIWLFMLHLWGLSPLVANIDVQRVGPMADWFTGIITVGVVCVGILALRTEREKFEHQIMLREQDRKEALERASETKLLAARQEASQVYFWLRRKDDLFGRLTAVEIHFENRTFLPVFDWNLHIRNPSLQLSAEAEGPLIPGHSLITRSGSEWLKTVDRFPIGAITFTGVNGEVIQRGLDGSIAILESDSAIDADVVDRTRE